MGAPDTDRSAAPLRRAMETIRGLREQLAASRPDRRIAIVGMSVRAPGGIADPDAYWSALEAGRDLTGELPAERRAVFGAQWDGLPTRGGYLDGVLDFDAEFFGMGPRETRSVDPQHRMLLEVVWNAFEDAGIQPAEVRAGTGVFVGITGQDYRDWAVGEPSAHWTVGNGHSFSAGRIAYTFGFQGPTVALDTACSSSLVAVHNACRALVAGDCDLAVVGGVNHVLSPRSTREISMTGALSPDGQCRPFDARANGFVRGEGCGALVLKRLEDAGQDRILAVIEATAINQDGQSAGFTAPDVGAQIRLIEGLLAATGLKPSDIGYLEAHGTGTALGDPIELEAVAAAIGRVNGGGTVYVGSVKANLGHAEAAAGMLGLIKAVQALRSRRVPPQIRYDTLNPRIDLAGTGLRITTEALDWGPEAGSCAAVSSFGMSGTNALAVLSPAPEPSSTAPVRRPSGFAISARTMQALRELAASYAAHLESLPEADYPAFAYTATAGRTPLPVARWVAADNAADARAALAALARGEEDERVLAGAPTTDPVEPAPVRAVRSLPGYPWQRSPYSIRPIPG